MPDDLLTLISKFKKTELSKYPDVTKYEHALESALWVLWLAEEKFKYDDYLTAGQIAEILRVCKVSFQLTALIMALRRAGNKVDTAPYGAATAYKIMQKGIEHLQKLQGLGNVEVFMFEGNKQHTSRRKITDVVMQAKGALLVVDKFYSRQTLNMLRQFEHGVEIRMLTAELAGGESESKFLAELVGFKQEYKNIKIRKYPKAYELHDRYVITDDSLILLGHGLIDIGSKESLVIVLKNENAKEIKDSLSAKFEERWQRSANL